MTDLLYPFSLLAFGQCLTSAWHGCLCLLVLLTYMLRSHLLFTSGFCSCWKEILQPQGVSEEYSTNLLENVSRQIWTGNHCLELHLQKYSVSEDKENASLCSWSHALCAAKEKNQRNKPLASNSQIHKTILKQLILSYDLGSPSCITQIYRDVYLNG